MTSAGLLRGAASHGSAQGGLSAHPIGHQPTDRYAAHHTLATSFATGEWVPEGLTGQDMRLIGEGIIGDIVHRIANG